jgi:Na+-driven multidrug efflux pump
MRKIREDQKEIIRIAVPAVLESLIAVIITTIDTRMISPLGSAAGC